MEPPAEKTSEGTSATPDKKHSPEFLIACAMMNDRIPDFWYDRPQAWFFKFEACMSLQDQDDDYKYGVALTKLNCAAIHAISDLIRKPPATGKYKALKEVLLNSNTNEKDKKFVKIMDALKSSNMSMTSNMLEQKILLKRIEKLLSCTGEVQVEDDSSDGFRVVYCSRGWQCWSHYRFGPHSPKCDDEVRCALRKCLRNN